MNHAMTLLLYFALPVVIAALLVLLGFWELHRADGIRREAEIAERYRNEEARAGQ